MIQIALQQGDTVADLRRAITASYPELQGIIEQAVFAINTDYASESTEIRAEDEIACIPPVSGG